MAQRDAAVMICANLGHAVIHTRHLFSPFWFQPVDGIRIIRIKPVQRKSRFCFGEQIVGTILGRQLVQPLGCKLRKRLVAPRIVGEFIALIDVDQSVPPLDNARGILRHIFPGDHLAAAGIPLECLTGGAASGRSHFRACCACPQAGGAPAGRVDHFVGRVGAGAIGRKVATRLR